ncbi:MAG: Gfo/Idh/MocA family oxidoreductase [Planctomycetota bacterium]
MNQSKNMSRRQFASTAIAAAGALAIRSSSIRSDDKNNKLNIAIIGSGGRGGSNLGGVSSQNIVALCDVSAKNVDSQAAKYPNAKKYSDFRKVFDHAKDFDAVVVSTCEHTHAFATILALQAGKHVYCEKPLTHNIFEARKIREAAAKANVTTQMGIQIHATDNYRRVVELVQAGAIGKVTEAHVWVSRAWGLQSAEDAKKNKDILHVTERPTVADPIPAGLDWDLWQGPAVERPFSSIYVPGPKWYRWWDYGNGTMSDLGSHRNDLAFWALKLQAPLSIEAFGPPAHADLAPASMRAVYDYGPRGDMPAVKLTWYQGDEKPELYKSGAIPKWGDGVLFVGDKGMLLADYGKHVLLPEKQFADFKQPEKTLPRVTSHHAEWMDACKAGKQSSANFEYAGWLTEANHLGNVAYRVGKKLMWDPVTMRATNAPEADKFIQREYRKGWEFKG